MRQQAGVPHGAHHRRYSRGGKETGNEGPRHEKCVLGMQRQRAKRRGMRPQKRRARQGGESENGETGTTGHKKTVSHHRRCWRTLSGKCAGNKEEARYFMRKLDKHTAKSVELIDAGSLGYGTGPSFG